MIRELRRQNQELATEIFLLNDAASLLVNLLGNASALKSMVWSDVQLLRHVIEIINQHKANAQASGSLSGAAQPRDAALIQATLQTVQAERHSPSTAYRSILMQVLRNCQQVDRRHSSDAAPPATTTSSSFDPDPRQTEWEVCD